MPRVKADPDAPGGVATTSTPLAGGANGSTARKRSARRIKTDPDDRPEQSPVGTAAASSRKKARRVNDSYPHPVSCGDVRKVKRIKPDPDRALASKGKGGDDVPGPYPNFRRPTPGDAYRAVEELASLHGEYEHGESGTVLDSLVRTMLSQNTTDITSARAFAQLKAKFPNWEDAERSTVGEIAKQVKCCGLADIRAERIMGILRSLRQERGELSMEYVRELDDEAVKKELCRFKGVGPKTAACVLLFCLRRASFPVDTHVWRITKKLGWVPEQASRIQAYEHLNRRVPDDIKLSLHVLLVEHGKCCKKCAKNGNPRRAVIGPCPLTFSRISLEEELIKAAGKIKVKLEPEAASGASQKKRKIK